MVYKHRDPEWLRKKYIDERKSQKEIAEIVGVTQGAIWRALKKHGIRARTISESNSGKGNGAWKENPIKDKDLFYEAYITDDLGLSGVAERFGVSKRTAARWRDIHEIPEHDKCEWHRRNLRTDTKNPNWRGGPSYCECGNIKSASSVVCGDCHYIRKKQATGKRNPNYRGNVDLMVRVRSHVSAVWRPQIFERDGYTCVKCGDDRGGNLHAHHIKRLRVIVDEIIGDTEITDIDEFEATVDELKSHPEVLDLDNGATLCTKCHRKVHYGVRTNLVPVI